MVFLAELYYNQINKDYISMGLNQDISSYSLLLIMVFLAELYYNQINKDHISMGLNQDISSYHCSPSVELSVFLMTSHGVTHYVCQYNVSIINNYWPKQSIHDHLTAAQPLCRNKLVNKNSLPIVYILSVCFCRGYFQKLDMAVQCLFDCLSQPAFITCGLLFLHENCC